MVTHHETITQRADVQIHLRDGVIACGFFVLQRRGANRLFAVLNALLGSVGGLALFVASLGMAKTMIMAVYERTREIGVLKAIGTSRGDVLRLFVAEAALIGFLGGVLGLVLGALLAREVDWAAHQYLASQGCGASAPCRPCRGGWPWGQWLSGRWWGWWQGSTLPSARPGRTR